MRVIVSTDAVGDPTSSGAGLNGIGDGTDVSDTVGAFSCVILATRISHNARHKAVVGRPRRSAGVQHRARRGHSPCRRGPHDVANYPRAPGAGRRSRVGAGERRPTPQAERTARMHAHVCVHMRAGCNCFPARSKLIRYRQAPVLHLAMGSHQRETELGCSALPFPPPILH